MWATRDNGSLAHSCKTTATCRKSIYVDHHGETVGTEITTLRLFCGSYLKLWTLPNRSTSKSWYAQILETIFGSRLSHWWVKINAHMTGGLSTGCCNKYNMRKIKLFCILVDNNVQKLKLLLFCKAIVLRNFLRIIDIFVPTFREFSLNICLAVFEFHRYVMNSFCWRLFSMWYN